MKTTTPSKEITKETMFVLTGWDKPNRLATLTEIEAEFPDVARLVKQDGYAIPADGNLPEAHAIKNFRVGSMSADSYGKLSWRTFRSLKSVRAYIVRQFGNISAEGGYVTDDGIARFVSFKAASESSRFEMPRHLALPQ